MKKLFLYPFFLFSIVNITCAQVGINTEKPAATLDVVASMENTDVPPGFIPPRLTLKELTSISEKYKLDQTGTIIYITDVSGTTNTSTTDITSIGYYFFDGKFWKSVANTDTLSPWYKINTESSSSANTDDSYLSAKAVIGGNVIQSINGGTSNAQLTVTGGDASINGITVGRGAGSVTTNTAIGTSVLNKNTTGASNTALGANAGTNITTGNNNLVVGSNANVVTASGNNQMNIGNVLFGNVGSSLTDFGQISVGKTTPDKSVVLDVEGLTQITGDKSFRYVDGKQALNNVLISDADGNASWEKLNILNSPIYSPAYSTGYTGVLKKGINSGITITLPPYSVWVIELGQIVRFNRYLKVYQSSSGDLVSENAWVRLTWSDTSTGDTTPDVLSGKLISGSCYAGGEFRLISGTSVIQNSTAADKTYYLTTDNCNLYFIDPTSPVTVEGLFQNWGENSLVAIPANNQNLDPENGK